jgi:Na+/H+ antiporter NhaD/arsenite permease-like protein
MLAKVLLLYVLLFTEPASAIEMMPPLSTTIPFAGVLLSIALGPLLFPALWHRYDNAVLAIWTAISTWLCFSVMGKNPSGHMVAGIILKEYIPFIVLVGTLYIISSGISIRVNKPGTTGANIAIIIVGELLSNLIGTTGTSMLLLRPMLEVNKYRKYKAHTVVFFIFLVSNIGGCLLPIGDPPLFLGYLKGVDFFWTLQHMFPMFVTVSAALLAIYAAIDQWLLRKEPKVSKKEKKAQDAVSESPPLHVAGYLNIVLMIVVAVLVAGAGMLPKKEAFAVFGTSVHYKGLFRDGGLVLIAIMSLWYTNVSLHKKLALPHLQKISWTPISEVARYFIAIFITMAPIAVMLKGGHEFFSPVCDVLKSTPHAPFWYFWFVSPFSAFLDNAPTYVVFFKMAGGNVVSLMTEHANTLMAISAGSVFMGAMTYIGNAPNFMVKSIAKQHGVEMPSFVGYMAWSSVILLPVMVAASYLFLY